MRRVILLGLLLLMLPLTLGYTNTSILFNSTEIGIYKMSNLTILMNQSGVKNLTITRIDTNNKFIMTYPTSISTSANSTKISFQLKLNTKYSENFTELEVFNITKRAVQITINSTFNSTTNTTVNRTISKILTSSYLYGINANYKYIKNNTAFAFVVIGGDTVVNLSSTLSNRKDTLSYRLAGTYGYTVNVTCKGSWITCDSNTAFGADNTVKFLFSYTIPLTAPAGTTKNYITFSYGALNFTKTITFNVHEPDISMLVYNPPEECVVYAHRPNSAVLESAVVSSCLDKYQEFYTAQLKKYLSAYAPENVTPIKEYIDHYIMYGNISKVTMDELTTCRRERAEFTTRMIDLNDANLYLTKNTTSCLLNRHSDYINFQKKQNQTASYWRDLRNQDKINIEKKWKTITFCTIGALILVLLIAFWLKSHQDELLDTLEGDD